MNIACDLDGTLAHYDKWRGIEHIGEPIPGTVYRVKKALSLGHKVYIFTARAGHGDGAEKYIEEWCLKHLGVVLPVTANKGYEFTEFWDDRAVAVLRNTGTAPNTRYTTLWAELGDGHMDDVCDCGCNGDVE